MKTMKSVRRGFTAVELLVTVLFAMIIVIVLLPSMGGSRGARPLRDATQVRTVVQALVVFANNNQGQYPLPSLLDADNGTIDAGDEPWTKDNTGNILSLLIFHGSISTEGCISPAEANTEQVYRDERYEFSDPTAAAAAGGDPAKALWDPGFAGTPLDPEPYRRGANLPGAGRVGHQSYAQAIPVGERRKAWSSTFSSTEAVFGNRGPAYVETAYPGRAKFTLNPSGAAAPGLDSHTLLIHGSRKSWTGNIAFNDGHVAVNTEPLADGVTYPRGAAPPNPAPDHLFIDETDEHIPPQVSDTGWRARRNNYLRPISRMPGPGVVPIEASAGIVHFWVD